jgi:hypothetical protein
VGEHLLIPYHASLAGARRAGLSCADIEREVREALAAGRASAERPAWLKPGAPADPGCRYCWPEHERHAFVVAFRPHFVLVKTCVTPSLVRRDFRRCQGPPAGQQALERAMSR